MKKFGDDLPMTAALHLAHLLSATHVDDQSIGLLRDGTEALVGVLAMVVGLDGADIDQSVQ